MASPNFPSTGLVPNVTTFNVGETRYLWDGEKWKAIIPGLSADKISTDDGLTSQGTHNATKALLVAQGLSGNYGFFEKGFDYVNVGDVGIDVDGGIYTYVGFDAPVKTVAPGTDPVGDSDYQNITFNKIIYLKSLIEINRFSDLLTEGSTIVTDSFWGGFNVGGATYTWNNTRSKSDHDGITVIDPIRTLKLISPEDYSDYYQAGVSGLGCLELSYDKAIHMNVCGFYSFLGFDSRPLLRDISDALDISQTVINLIFPENEDVYLDVADINNRTDRCLRFSNKKKVHIDYNGCRFLSNYNIGQGERETTLLETENCRDIKSHSLIIENIDKSRVGTMDAIVNRMGIRAHTSIAGDNGIILSDLDMRYAYGAFTCRSNGGNAPTNKSKNIQVYNITGKDIVYPLSAAQHGDNLKGWNIEVEDVHRAGFYYGVKGVDVEMTVNGQVGTGVRLWAVSGEDLRDINLKLDIDHTTSNGVNSIEYVQLVVNDTEARTISDVKIDINLDARNNGDFGVAFICENNPLINKHVMDNIEINGVIKNTSQRAITAISRGGSYVSGLSIDNISYNLSIINQGSNSIFLGADAKGSELYLDCKVEGSNSSIFFDAAKIAAMEGSCRIHRAVCSSIGSVLTDKFTLVDVLLTTTPTEVGNLKSAIVQRLRDYDTGREWVRYNKKHVLDRIYRNGVTGYFRDSTSSSPSVSVFEEGNIFLDEWVANNNNTGGIFRFSMSIYIDSPRNIAKIYGSVVLPSLTANTTGSVKILDFHTVEGSITEGNTTITCSINASSEMEFGVSTVNLIDVLEIVLRD